MQPTVITLVALNAINIVLFANRIAKKTPFRLPIWKWNYPHRYQVFTLSCGILSQLFNVINKLIYDERDGGMNWSGYCGLVFYQLTFAGVAFASLYRYERLHLEVKGSRGYNILRAVRISIILITIISFGMYAARKYTQAFVQAIAYPFYLMNGISGAFATLWCWIVDTSSSALMIRTILGSTKKSLNSGNRMTRFIVTLQAILVIEMLLGALAILIHGSNLIKMFHEERCIYLLIQRIPRECNHNVAGPFVVSFARHD